jgi:predicted nucleotidyltransferase
VPEDIVQRVASVASKHGVAFAYVFGSVAQGTAGPLSDIDVGVEFDRRPTEGSLKARLDSLYRDLSEILPGVEVNVVLLRQAPWQLQFDAVSVGRLAWCGDVELHSSYIETVLRHWHDFSWVVDRFHSEVAQEIRRGGFLAKP